jgi:hypothetical protein
MFLGLNLPDAIVGVAKPALALGVGSTTPTLGTGVGIAPGVGVSGLFTEIDSTAAPDGRLTEQRSSSPDVNWNSAGDLDKRRRGRWWSGV